MATTQIVSVPMVSKRWKPTALGVLAASILLCHAVSAATVDIAACGATVDHGDTGVLQADLDCSASLFGVRLLSRATLDLNGHTIAGGAATEATVVGVANVDPSDPIGVGSGHFTIVGPGVITGTHTDPFDFPGTDACVLLNRGRARITSATGSVEIAGCVYGVLGSNDVTPNRGRLQIDHAILHDFSEDGVGIERLKASDVTVYNAEGIGLGTSTATVVHDIVAHDNSIGIFGGKQLVGTNVTTTNNHANGVDSFGRIVITNLMSTNNGLFGVAGPRGVTLTDSTVMGNAIADIESGIKPVLVNTTCGSSTSPTNMPWGVCTND